MDWLSLHRLVLVLEFWSFLSFGPYFFVSTHLLHCKGPSLRYSPVQDYPLHCIVVLYVGEGSEREQCLLIGPCPTFSHFPHYPQANWALLVLVPGWEGLCMFREPVALSNEFSCESGSFPWWNPVLHGLSLSPVVPPGLPTHKGEMTRSTGHHGPPTAASFYQSSSCCLSGCPLCPSCLSPPLLLDRMYVSCLTSWLLDFIQDNFLAVPVILCF